MVVRLASVAWTLAGNARSLASVRAQNPKAAAKLAKAAKIRGKALKDRKKAAAVHRAARRAFSWTYLLTSRRSAGAEERRRCHRQEGAALCRGHASAVSWAPALIGSAGSTLCARAQLEKKAKKEEQKAKKTEGKAKAVAKVRRARSPRRSALLSHRGWLAGWLGGFAEGKGQG